MSIGRTLVELRSERHLFQKELAAYLNVSVGTISNYEQDLHAPDLENLSKIADFYGVTTDYLLGRTKYRYELDDLNMPITDNYTFVDMVNTSLELTRGSMRDLVSYVEYLVYREKQIAAKDVPQEKSRKGGEPHR